VGDALQNQAHYCCEVQHRSETDFQGASCTAAKAASANQQKGAQYHQKNIQTLSRHSCEPQKQQKIFSQPQLALSEPQKL
jgi:hypothetical protein